MSAYSRDLAAIGGPLGRYAKSQPWRYAIWPLVALAMLPMQLGVLQKAFCIDHGWSDQDMFWRACYSDVPIQWQVGNLGRGLGAYLTGDADVPHPVVTGSLMSLLGGLVPDATIVAQQRFYFLLWAVVATGLLMVTVWLTAATTPRLSPWAAHVAASPVLIGAALVSTDLFAVALVAAGMWAWSRRHPTAAGVLLGLATMARTYPGLVIIGVLFLAIRTQRWRGALRMVGSAAATALAVCVPFLVLGGGSAITAPYAEWGSGAAGLGSPWLVPQLITTAGAPSSSPPVLGQIADLLHVILGHRLPTLAVTILAVIGMVLAILAGLALATGASRRPRLAEIVLVMVVIVLITGKSFPVQASVWLIPLIALAGLRWRDHLIWAGCEISYFVAVWLYQGGLSRADRGLPPAWYAMFVVLRLAGVAWLGIAAWRQAMARAEHEPDPEWAEDPDRDEVVDEAAGDFAGARDKVLAVWR